MTMLTPVRDSVVDGVERVGRFGAVRRLGKAGALGIVGLGAILLVSLVGPLVMTRPRTNVSLILQSPSAAHVLGTDFAGRDNLALLVFGGADMLYLAAVAGVLMSLIAVVLGMFSAYVGGWVDRIVMWVTDLWLTIPRFILLLVIASLARIDSTFVLAVLIAVFGWPFLARQVRTQTLSIKGRDYVEAARLLDLRRTHILIRYLLPAMAPFVVISTIQAMVQAIYQQVGLAFFGIVPLTDNWGVLFSVAYRQNAIYLREASWSLLSPVAAICLLQLCLVLFSRALEEVFDPRLRLNR